MVHIVVPKEGYVCDVCEQTYSTRDGAEKCEALGKPTPKYEVGDEVTILTGDGAGCRATITRVFYYSPSWGGMRYAHKVGYTADLIGSWGSRQLIEGESV